jgi:hypothetical protein
LNIDERLWLYQECITLWGVEAQEKMIIEEAGELLKALMKFTRNLNGVTRDEVLDEITDFQIMLEEAPIIYGFSQTELNSLKTFYKTSIQYHDLDTQVKMTIKNVAHLILVLMDYSLDKTEENKEILKENIVFAQIIFEHVPKIYNFSQSEVETRRDYKLDRLRNRYFSSKNRNKGD